MVDRFRSLIEREKEKESRVHTELTQQSRERMATITDFARREHQLEALRKLMERVGTSEIEDPMPDDVHSSEIHRAFIENADTLLVLSYLELLINHTHTLADRARYMAPYTYEEVHNKTLALQDVLETEGLLWSIEDGDEEYLQFERLASERMKEADNELRSLSMDEKWEDALKGYNAAFNLYLDGKYGKEIPEKLYNSIEEVLQTICVDLEGWTDNRDQSHSVYLNLLREHEIYKAHGITNPELELLLDSLTKLVNKVGGDRKQRHEYIDRQYCTLLIHQVAAYLYFLINRYEDWTE